MSKLALPPASIFSADSAPARQCFLPIAGGLPRPLRPVFSTTCRGDLYGEALGEFNYQQPHSLESAPAVAEGLSAANAAQKHVISRFL